MRKISLKFLIALISSLIIVTAVIIIACGPDYYDPTYSFFPQELIPAGIYTPFYKSELILFGMRRTKETNIHDFDSINIDEWSAFFVGKVTIKDLGYLIKKARIGEIDTLIYFLKNPIFPLSNQLVTNTILNYSDKNIVRQFLFYLGFAKRCETFATFRKDFEYWYDIKGKYDEKEIQSLDPRNNKDSMKVLVSGGLKQLHNVNNMFIYERYLFQIVRLYYHGICCRSFL